MINSYDLEIIHYALIKLYNDSVDLMDNGFKPWFSLDHVDDVTDDIEHIQAKLSASKSKCVSFIFEED